MKKLIIPIVIVIGLIVVYFYIFDRKEFNHYDRGNGIQAERIASSSSRKLASVSTSESKPETEISRENKEQLQAKTELVTGNQQAIEINNRPFTENTPKSTVETKSSVENNPADVEFSTEKELAAETKTIVEAQSEDINVPAAVPVVSAEEAEKLNSFAIFLSTVKPTIVEGEIIERSELPDPQKSDYPNCRFTAHFKGNSIIIGKPCPKELSLIVEGFENYHILPNNNIKKGDKVRCAILPFELLPDDYQSTQQADDLELFLLENYYVASIKLISTFSDSEFLPKSGIYYLDGNKDYISIFSRHINSPIPQDIIDSQNEAIRDELTKMDELLSGYSDTRIKEINALFSKTWEKEKLNDKDGFNRLETYVWRNIDNSFWCLPENYSMLIPPFNPLSNKTLDCFTALNNVCNSNGVQLLVALVPNNYVISSRIINSQFRNIPDIQMASYVKQLSEIGIEAIYSADSIIQNYNRFEFAYNYPLDYHPADTTQDVIADLIAERLGRFEFPNKLEKSLFSIVKESPHSYREKMDYCFHNNCDIASHQDGEPYLSRKVIYNNKVVQNEIDAPVLMVGNSFMESPVYPSKSAPSILSYKTLLPINWRMFYSFGPFTELLTQLFTNPSQILSGKKVLVYYFGVEHLSRVNDRSSMINIREMDDECILLNNKTLCRSFSIQSNTEPEDSELIANKLGDLRTESAIKILENGEWSQTFVLDEIDIDILKPAICIIPASCGAGEAIKLSVGSQSKQMYSPTYSTTARLFSHVFELPAGTKELSVNAKGKKGTFFAIKDIQIWQ